jgi:thymidylate synthase (FAD)
MLLQELKSLALKAVDVPSSLSPTEVSRLGAALSFFDGLETTGRFVSPGAENWLGKEVPVLDHGFIRLIDYMGGDSAIVQAARVSYGKGTKTSREDAGLVRYLLRNKHTTPFEMCEIKIHCKMPIFVARQWIRHRTANVNEYSGRYSIIDREFYVPQDEHLAAQSSDNKQGRGAVLEGAEAARVLEILKQDSATAYDHYLEMANYDEEGKIIDPSKQGLARELARMNLPVNFYTQWYWKIDLHNLLHFLNLRLHPHAQYEIRAYAEAITNIVKEWCPVAYQAFVDYVLESFTLTKKEQLLLGGILLAHNEVGYVEKLAEMSGFSASELSDLRVKLGKMGV